MFKNPLASPEAKHDLKTLASNNKESKLRQKNVQRKRDLAKKVAVKKNPERGHEERYGKRMQQEGDRSASDYRG